MTRAIFGGHIDLASSLNQIDFSSGEGEMRTAIAYIRRWKRGNSAQIGSSFLSSNLTAITNEWRTPEGPIAELTSLNSLTSPFDSRLNFSSSQDIIFSRDLANSTPSYTYVDPSTDLSTPLVPNAPDLGQSLGQLKPANPQSFFSRFFSNVFNGSRPPYSGVAGAEGKVKGTNFALDVFTEGTWQFLFNPSELSFETGPEYKTSETWAVSDKENSGQPLHWTHNKNAVLKFNSVVLNGYVFGRQVEELQQGLFDLFTSRGGSGQDGPDILEFVWGKRVFGPCVIKNIVVKEKAWDDGLLVNAEVSFELEKIPEWTINDGFVDVARPAAQPIVNEVLQVSAGATTGVAQASSAEASSITTPAPSAPATPTPPSAPDPCKSFKEANCRELVKQIKNFERLNVTIQDTSKELKKIERFTPAGGSEQSNQFLTTNVLAYERIYRRAEGLFGTCFTSKISPSQTPEALLRTNTINGVNNQSQPIQRRYALFQTATFNAAGALRRLYADSKCARQGVPL